MSRYRAIVIGASAGALEALSAVLAQLPGDFPVPLVIVVHLPAGKDSLLAEILQSRSVLRVLEAEDKQAMEPGHAYIAPPDYHLLAETDGHLSLSADEEVMYSRPSIDVLFESAADAFGDAVIGIVLTGANSDGALGLKAISGHGGLAIVQQPKGAYAGTMPQSALAACPGAAVLDLDAIGPYLMKACA